MKGYVSPYAGHLMLAALLSIAGQVSAITFMIRPNPYTTFAFMTAGSGMILLGMVVFAYVMFKEIRARTRSITERRFRKGEFVFHQGDVGNRVYIVQSGEVEVIREDPDGSKAAVEHLGKGDYFGEKALLTDAPRRSTVRAVTDITTLAIERRDFHSLFSGIPAFKHSIEVARKKREATKPD